MKQNERTTNERAAMRVANSVIVNFVDYHLYYAEKKRVYPSVEDVRQNWQMENYNSYLSDRDIEIIVEMVRNYDNHEPLKNHPLLAELLGSYGNVWN